MTKEQHTAIQTYSLLVIAIVLSGAALAWLKPVLIPFVLSLMLAVGLSPTVKWFERVGRMPSWGAVSLSLFIGLLIVLALSVLIGHSLRTAVAQSGELESRLHGMYELGVSQLQSLGVEIDRAAITDQLKSLPIGSAFGAVATGLLNALSDSFLILFFLVYWLQGTAEQREVEGSVASRIRLRVRGYLSIKLGLSIFTGLMVWAVLAGFGVPMAAMFGVLTIVLNFIPSVGSIIATVLPIPFLILSPEFSGTEISAIIVICGLVQMIVGNVLEPKLLGDSLELHPVTILVTLVFWGMLWGVPGMFLATPLTAVLCILMNEFQPTRPFAALLAGQPSTADESKAVEPVDSHL